MPRRVLLPVVLIGAALLLAAEPTPLFVVRAGRMSVDTVRAGSHHGYALVFIALAAVGLAAVGTQAALAGVGALGAAGLAVALLVDLPGVRASGYVEGFVRASAQPRVGFWLELAGGAVLLVTGLVAVLRSRSGP